MGFSVERIPCYTFAGRHEWPTSEDTGLAQKTRVSRAISV
jgi:hypothetical protein